MFIDRNELIKAYLLAEKSRLKLWEILDDPSPLSFNEVESLGMEQMVSTETNGRCIKITINDILPRNVEIPKSNLEIHWLGIMHKALKDINAKYEKVLCVIKVYNTAYYWDVDNRTYSIIINSLRYNRIIPNDRFDNLSFMVMGGVDRDNPRTEIYLLEHPEDPFFFVTTNP